MMTTTQTRQELLPQACKSGRPSQKPRSFYVSLLPTPLDGRGQRVSFDRRSIMSFSFNFLSQDDNDVPLEDKAKLDNTGKSDDSKNEEAAFHWLTQEQVKASLEENFKNVEQLQQVSRVVRLSASTQSPKVSSFLRQVQEDLVSSSSQQFPKNTDLVPGVYEGGLKVWECSLDLCQYLCKNGVEVHGHVLELGCGHALPACWVLKRALQTKADKRWVTFSDYNEFVLKDITLKNVVLNVIDGLNYSAVDTEILMNWLTEHTAFGAGDWNQMSKLLMARAEEKPPAVPNDGLYDCILAAETTYSEKAATQTAELIARHLRPGKGVAYVATKRYYFGVRGGTSCFVDALKSMHASYSFDVKVLEEYDNGAGNIRDLLMVQSLPTV